MNQTISLALYRMGTPTVSEFVKDVRKVVRDVQHLGKAAREISIKYSWISLIALRAWMAKTNEIKRPAQICSKFYNYINNNMDFSLLNQF